MHYHCKNLEKPKVLLLEATGISVVNIGGTIIHFGLGIKPGTNLLGLSDIFKAALRKRLSEVKLLIIDKIYIVSSNLWSDVDSRFGEIFMMVPEKRFSDLSVMIVADLIQPPPVRGKVIFFQFFDKDSTKHFSCLLLLHLFKYAGLTEAVRQLKTWLMKLELVTLITMQNICSREDLYKNLTKAIQKIPCTCQRSIKKL